MFYTRPTTAPTATDVTMCRKGCSDAEWHRVQQLPRAYSSSQVSSSWEFEGSGADWLTLVGPAAEHR